LFKQGPFYLLAGLNLAWAGLLVWGSINIRSGFYLPAFYKGIKGQNSIALSYDDGPSEEFTPAVLDMLKKHNIKACFFCIGEKALDHPEIIKRIDEEGHLIGIHSMTHSYFFDLFSKKRMIAELEDTTAIIKNITGKECRWFRPPYGVSNPPLAKAVNHCRLLTIGWSLKTKDTSGKKSSVLIKRIEKKINKRDMILMHDNREVSIKLTEKIIEIAKNKNYKISRPDHLLNIQAYNQK